MIAGTPPRATSSRSPAPPTPSPASRAATLLDHGFRAFERREVIAAGEPLGEVRIGDRDVSVASGGSLVALIPVNAEVTRRILVDPYAAFPPLPGELVGAVRVSVPGLRIGRV